MRKIPLIIIILIALKVHGQTFKFSDFIEMQPPKINSSDWYKLNYSQNEFSVRNVNGDIIISKEKPGKSNELILKNGRLIGQDYGEWGGSLVYIPNDKTRNQIEIKEGNVKYVFWFKNEICF